MQGHRLVAHVPVLFARTLERELNAANAENAHLRADLAQRTAERDEAQKDAQRYRWLHSKGCYWIEIQSQPHGDYIFRGQAWADLKYGGLDAAIDAVIALQKQGGGA